MLVTTASALNANDEQALGQTLHGCRIAIVSDAIYNRNGVGTFYLDLISQLSDLVESIQLCCPGDQISERHRLASIPLPGDSTQRLCVPRYGFMNQWFAEVRPHIVIIPTLGPYGYSAAKAAHSVKATVCLANHTDFDRLATLYWSSTTARALQAFFSLVDRWADVYADLKLDVHQASRRCAVPQLPDGDQAWAASRSGQRHTVGTLIGRELLQQPLAPFPKSIQRVTFLGRLAQEKNLPALFEAAARLPHLEFCVCGDGPLRPAVIEQQGKLPNLKYHGWLDRQQAIEMLDQSSLLLLPSTVESFGTVALEAMTRGRLAVVSRNCGITEWDSLANHLLLADDSSQIVDQIRALEQLNPATLVARCQLTRSAAVRWNDEIRKSWIQLISHLYAHRKSAQRPFGDQRLWN